MSEKLEPVILHEAFEDGQARAWGQDESRAWVWTAVILGMIWGVPLGILAGGGIALWQDLDYPLCLAIGAVGGYLTVSGAVLIRGMWPQFGRLWSEREARTYAPPQPQPPQLSSPWRPPVPVHRREGTTLLDMNERPALPSPQEARQITPPVVAEILRASIEEYGGQWSRRKLMRLRVLGQKVSRGMYEELTSALHQCGVLRQNRQGGFELPHDIERFEDLAPYLPSLPGLGGMGGGTGRDEDGGGSDDPPPGGEVRTLAERHRLARLGELEHSVRDYLEKKGLADV